MTDITPEKVATTVSRSVESGWRHRLQAALSVTAEDNVLSLSVTRWADDEEGTEIVRHFRAVVVPGEQVPLVLDRPDVNDHSTMQGPRFGEDEGESPQNGWSVFATNHIVFGGSGHISFAEARRMGAALIALADVREADSEAAR